MADDLKLVMTKADLAAFFVQAFAGNLSDPDEFEVLEPGFLRMKLEPHESMLRPGRLVSGPTQMGLADRAAYAVILAHIGPVAMAVTSNLNMSFLRGVKFETFYADAHLLKLGRRLATVDVRIWQGEPGNVAAQSTVTYAIPAS